MGGTMMDSTRRSLAGAIQDARGGREGNAGPKNSGAKYFGGWEGGSGGTFGKAARAVGEPRQQQKNQQRSNDPLGPSQAPNSPIGASSYNTGRRQRIRPNSAGAQSIWNSTSVGQLPKAPPPGTSPRIAPRPNTAQPSRDRQTLAATECTLARGSLSLTSPKALSHNSPGKAANVPPRSPASRPKGPPAFTDPFRSATLSHTSRDPFSIMATLQHGMTFDTKDMHASHALQPPEVSAPHQHVTKPHVVHPPSPPSFSPPPAQQDPSIGDHDANSRARVKWQDSESGDPDEVTIHPSAGDNLAMLASIDENQSTGGGTLRQQLSQAAAVTPKRVQQIVKAMRVALKKRATLYRTKQMQLDALMSQEGDSMGQVAVDGLSRLAMCLGVDITHPEALAFCTHHGFTSLAVPNDALCSLLLANSSSKATSEAPTKRQPFSRTAAPTVANCKINYRPCKTPVYTPTEWPRTGEAIVERSAQLPDARLILDFVYGYAGFNNTSCNLFYNCNRQVLYYVAGVAIVYTPPADSTDGSGAPAGHTQNYFLGHDDDIKSMALCPSAVQVDNRSFPANSIAATGQVCSTSHGPYICVWDSVGYEGGIEDREGSHDIGVEEIRRIELEKSYRGVGALGFSPDGRYLVAVALDNVHSVIVFDWRTGTALCEGRGFAGEPPQVYGVTWNPHLKDPSDFHFVTWGKKHCKLWTQSQNSRTSKSGSCHKDNSIQIISKQLSFGRFDLQNVHSAVFLPETHAMVLGLARGDLLVFSGTSAVRSISAHRSGPQFIADDGSVTFSGLRGLALHHGDTCLLTAGADGKICTWNVQDGTLDDASLQSTLQLQPQYGGAAKGPVVRAMCVSPLDKDIMVGTSACDIWEVNDNKQEVLMYGHGGSMHAVSWHPVRTSVFATACEAQRVFVFDATARSTIKTAATNMASRAVAWSCQPMRDGVMHHLALGGMGRILVLDEEALQPICEVRDGGHAINDLKYNPQSTVLAAACADRHVYLYTVGLKRYSRVAKCSGHSAAVRALDWRIDGQVLQSVCAACELLRWSGNTGRQITECQRDSQWATWTCNLGFPVMGIWYEGSDPTDINAVSRDSSGRFLATADDRGLVRLLNYPVVVSDAPSRGYVGHSAHVTCVRFSESSISMESRSDVEGSERTWLATCGGGDRAVFQFKLEEIKQEEPPIVEDPEPVWGPLDSQGKVFGWTKPLANSSSAAYGVNSSTQKLSPGQQVAAIDESEAKEVQSDDDNGSVDAGGWGDV